MSAPEQNVPVTDARAVAELSQWSDVEGLRRAAATFTTWRDLVTASPAQRVAVFGAPAAAWQLPSSPGAWHDPSSRMLVMSVFDTQFPAELSHVDPAAALWCVQGRLSSRPRVAVVSGDRVRGNEVDAGDVVGRWAARRGVTLVGVAGSALLASAASAAQRDVAGAPVSQTVVVPHGLRCVTGEVVGALRAALTGGAAVSVEPPNATRDSRTRARAAQVALALADVAVVRDSSHAPVLPYAARIGVPTVTLTPHLRRAEVPPGVVTAANDGELVAVLNAAL